MLFVFLVVCAKVWAVTVRPIDSFDLARSIQLNALPGGNSSSCIIPFTRAGNLILVQATANTTSGNFILDSGAPSLVLNPTYFRDYPTTLVADFEQTDITGRTAPLRKTIVPRFFLSSLTCNLLHADLANLGNIENS